MYTRVLTLQVQAGKLDELKDIFENAVVPEVKKAEGFVSLTLLENRKMNKALMMSTWASEATMGASDKSGLLQAAIAKFSACLTAPPVREVYEVSAQSS